MNVNTTPLDNGQIISNVKDGIKILLSVDRKRKDGNYKRLRYLEIVQIHNKKLISFHIVRQVRNSERVQVILILIEIVLFVETNWIKRNWQKIGSKYRRFKKNCCTS